MATEFSYDAVSYPGSFFLQMSPANLAVIGAFYGMNPPNVENCRVLELGCGRGVNLITQAFNFPDGKFIGIDLAENHIAEAKKYAGELNLANIEFHQMDVMNLSEETFGKFDYITAYGLFSWVPDFVREQVLKIFQNLLVPDGIGYLSYNTYPGSHYRQMTGKMMQFHTKNAADSLEKVDMALSFLDFLAESSVGDEIYKTILQKESQRQRGRLSGVIFHDDLSAYNQPFYFHEFNRLLTQNNLQFISDAKLNSSSLAKLPVKAREFIESLDSYVEREQYFDFLTGESFRETLFCHQEVKLIREPGFNILDKFWMASSVRPISKYPELGSNKVEKFVGKKDAGFEIDHPLTKAALYHLGKIWGEAIAVPELLEIARGMLEKTKYTTDDWEEQFETTKRILFQICRNTDLINLHLHHFNGSTELPKKPKTNGLTSWLINVSGRILTPLNIEMKPDDEVLTYLLKIADGTKTKSELLKELTDYIKTNDSITDKQRKLQNLSKMIDENLQKLARIGMFEQ